MQNKAKKTKQEIIINHIETDELISPEFIAELHKMIAKKLFEAWLEDRNKKHITGGEGATEGFGREDIKKGGGI